MDDQLLLAHLRQGDDAVDELTLSIMDEMKHRCLEISTPRAARIALSAGAHPFHLGGTILSHLRGSEELQAFICTIGDAPEEEAKSLLHSGSYLEAYVLDMWASTLTEATAEWVHQELRLAAGKRGLQVSNRFSPGYCGWKVEEQQKLFDLFPERCCGISLSPSSLMQPIKSISALVGIGREVRFRDYTCELCSMKDCLYRRSRKAST